MNSGDVTLPFSEFLRQVSARAARFMWFLGAGASRSALMPTANDLIWELKLRQYCREENQDIQQHDVSNRHVRQRVQAYFDSKGAPPAWDNAEYSFYFEREFGSDYPAQQRFLVEKLASEKISLNFGHRALAAMMAMGAAKVIFTTNFDEVVESAFAEMVGKSLQAFSLEGSYAALDALNADQFPLYAKLHGDFRFRRLKNLSADLKSNDAQIGRAFLAAANRFGIIVTGYSGRDGNVMQLFDDALSQANPFPAGLFWSVTRSSDATPEVNRLIERARAKGVTAGIVEAGTFDILLMRIWQQLSDRPPDLNAKVRPNLAEQVDITLPAPGNTYPLIRSNALPIIELPSKCGIIHCDPPLTWEHLRDGRGETNPVSPMAVDGGLLFWGERAEVEAYLKQSEIKERGSYVFDDPVSAIEGSTVLKGLFEHALACALVAEKPVVLRKRRREYFAVASNRREHIDYLAPLASAVGGGKFRAPVTGVVPRSDLSWAEAVSIRLDVRQGQAYLALNPLIWIAPMARREEATEFMRAREVKRYNSTSNAILDAWIRLLVGGAKNGENVKLTAFAGGDQPAPFLINNRTAFARVRGPHG